MMSSRLAFDHSMSNCRSWRRSSKRTCWPSGKERAVVVEDVKELDGMDAADIAAAAEGAKERGLEGKYLLEITDTTACRCSRR